MSGSADRIQRHYYGRNGSTPKALVHVKILEAARARPEASMECLADEVDGATLPLVERVLEEYGDPVHGESGEDEGVSSGDQCVDESPPDHEQGKRQAMDAEQTNTTSESAESLEESDDTPTDGTKQTTEPFDDRVEIRPDGALAITDGENADQRSTEDTSVPSPEQLTRKQMDVLRAIHANPHATQSELAELFDVNRSTISQRVNGIEGFEWKRRRALVETMFDGVEPLTDGDGRCEDVEELVSSIDGLTERVADLERAVEGASANQCSTFDDPELAGTVIRACIDSDTVTEDEELQIIAELIEAGRS